MTVIDILNLTETCSFFNTIINNEKSLWRYLLSTHYGQKVTPKLTRPKFLYRLIYRTSIARYIPFYHECDVTCVHLVNQFFRFYSKSSAHRTLEMTLRSNFQKENISYGINKITWGVIEETSTRVEKVQLYVYFTEFISRRCNLCIIKSFQNLENGFINLLRLNSCLHNLKPAFISKVNYLLFNSLISVTIYVSK